MNWEAQPYTNLDKRIEITGPLTLYVDYDDVNQQAADVLVQRLLDILNSQWRTPVMAMCTNEDCDKYWDHYFPFDQFRCDLCGSELEGIKVET